MAHVTEQEGGGEIGCCFISPAVKTESSLPRSFFAPKPNGNACDAGYFIRGDVKLLAGLLYPSYLHLHTTISKNVVGRKIKSL